MKAVFSKLLDVVETVGVCNHHAIHLHVCWHRGHRHWHWCRRSSGVVQRCGEGQPNGNAGTLVSGKW